MHAFISLLLFPPSLSLPLFPPSLSLPLFPPFLSYLPKRPPNPRKEMIAEEVRSIFNSNKLIAVYQCNNLTGQESFSLRVALDKGNFTMKVVPSKLSMRILEETRFRNVSPLLRGSTALVYSQEPDVAQLLQIMKAEPKVLLLGGLVENELMTPNGMKSYSYLPEKTAVLQQLVITLMHPQVLLSSQLMANPIRLSHFLQQISNKEP